jgi:SAM-dependent methyltransferase
VTVHLLEILDQQDTWHEAGLRERRWFSFDEAASLLADHPVAALLSRVRGSLGAVSAETPQQRQPLISSSPLAAEIDLYDGYYGHLASDPQRAVRRATYDEDLGQASWLTLVEAREWFRLLGLAPGQTALEVACGSGGVTCRMAVETQATCIGVDLNPRGIEAANRTAQDQGLSARVSFQVADAGQPLPFPSESFDAIFCNDSINHFPDRPSVLRDWHRVLRPGGRVLFTDPIVVTGQLTNEEIRVRSSIGFFLFTPPGHNERLLTESGFVVREVRDVTAAVASVSGKWRDARRTRRDALVDLEGAEAFEGLQRFLDAVHVLASERRLSRYMYLASRPTSGATAVTHPPRGG